MVKYKFMVAEPKTGGKIMEILKSMPETLSKFDLYDLTMGPSLMIKNCVGQLINVEAWCYRKDHNDKDDKDINILSIRDGDAIFSTNSDTFAKSFFMINQLMDGEPFTIKVVSGTSKAGREYFDCVLVRV